MIIFQTLDKEEWLIDLCCLSCRKVGHIHMDKIPVIHPMLGDPQANTIYQFKWYCGNCGNMFIEVKQKTYGEVVAEVEYHS